MIKGFTSHLDRVKETIRKRGNAVETPYTEDSVNGHIIDLNSEDDSRESDPEQTNGYSNNEPELPTASSSQYPYPISLANGTHDMEEPKHQKSILHAMFSDATEQWLQTQGKSDSSKLEAGIDQSKLVHEEDSGDQPALPPHGGHRATSTRARRERVPRNRRNRRRYGTSLQNVVEESLQSGSIQTISSNPTISRNDTVQKNENHEKNGEERDVGSPIHDYDLAMGEDYHSKDKSQMDSQSAEKWRMVEEAEQAFIELTMIKNSVLVIQAFARRFLAMHRLQRSKMSACLIQSMVRMVNERRKFLVERNLARQLADEDKAATVIVAWFRGRMAATLLEEMRRSKERLAEEKVEKLADIVRRQAEMAHEEAKKKVRDIEKNTRFSKRHVVTAQTRQEKKDASLKELQKLRDAEKLAEQKRADLAETLKRHREQEIAQLEKMKKARDTEKMAEQKRAELAAKVKRDKEKETARLQELNLAKQAEKLVQEKRLKLAAKVRQEREQEIARLEELQKRKEEEKIKKLVKRKLEKFEEKTKQQRELVRMEALQKKRNNERLATEELDKLAENSKLEREATSLDKIEKREAAEKVLSLLQSELSELRGENIELKEHLVSIENERRGWSTRASSSDVQLRAFKARMDNLSSANDRLLDEIQKCQEEFSEVQHSHQLAHKRTMAELAASERALEELSSQRDLQVKALTKTLKETQRQADKEKAALEYMLKESAARHTAECRILRNKLREALEKHEDYLRKSTKTLESTQIAREKEMETIITELEKIRYEKNAEIEKLRRQVAAYKSMTEKDRTDPRAQVDNSALHHNSSEDSYVKAQRSAEFYHLSRALQEMVAETCVLPGVIYEEDLPMIMEQQERGQLMAEMIEELCELYRFRDEGQLAKNQATLEMLRSEACDYVRGMQEKIDYLGYESSRIQSKKERLQSKREEGRDAPGGKYMGRR